jgi:hypothetical protein
MAMSDILGIRFCRIIKMLLESAFPRIALFLDKHNSPMTFSRYEPSGYQIFFKTRNQTRFLKGITPINNFSRPKSIQANIRKYPYSSLLENQ